ncbi:hypothetical protein [Yoonia sp. BS5-3]|uniref:Uncharacterized protein n=1 Tax=Yoonia phaeophyticola TaxID=3137369 RepID=A0ABZ2V5K1_9RHOB
MRTFNVGLAALICGVFGTASAADEMQFYITGNGGNCWSCEWAEAQGEITADTPARFAAFAAQYDFPWAIALDSTGGDPAAAMALGRLIRENGWDTDRRELGTPSGAEPERKTVCEDACVLAFMGGVERDIDPGISVTLVGEGAVPWISADVLEYTLEMGISAEVLTTASRVAAGQSYAFDAADHEGLGLDNVDWKTDPWYLEPYKAGLVLATRQYYGVGDGQPFTLFCREDDPRVHILIVEEGDFSNRSFPGGRPLVFSDDPMNSSAFIMGQDRYPLTEDHVEFLRQEATGLTASFRLPEEVVARAGEEVFFFPNLARVYGPVLQFTIPLPSAEWIAVMRRNCI